MKKILLMRSISTLLLSLLLVSMLPIQQAQAAWWDDLATLIAQLNQQSQQGIQNMTQVEQDAQAVKQRGEAVKQQI